MSLMDQFVEVALADPEPRRNPVHPVFLSQPVAAMTLEPAPIEPGWILSGTPQASAKLHSQSADGMSSTTLWRCTAGAFKWHFVWDETVHILSGSVTVTDATGKVTTLREGDVAYFAAGSWAVWEIDDHVQKIAFCRRAFPAPVLKAIKLKTAVAGLVRGKPKAASAVGGLAASGEA